MHHSHHHLRLSPALLAEGRFPQNRFKEVVPEAVALSGLSADFLASLPGEARREYLAAYSRARRLALMGEVMEKGDKRVS
ncbi:MAG: hypothetical protein REI12_10045 [Pedobacter sp.]|nr:hypothetical protein [Pedobacter sp.]